MESLGIKIDAVFSLVNDIEDEQSEVRSGDLKEANWPKEKDFIDKDAELDFLPTDNADYLDAPPTLPMVEDLPDFSDYCYDGSADSSAPPILSPEEPLPVDKPARKDRSRKRGRVIRRFTKIKGAWKGRKQIGTLQDCSVTDTIKPSAGNKRKILPCYIVLTKLGRELGDSYSVSYRKFQKQKRRECTNMCKKVQFKKRLAKGKNVFNVKLSKSDDNLSVHTDSSRKTCNKASPRANKKNNPTGSKSVSPKKALSVSSKKSSSVSSKKAPSVSPKKALSDIKKMVFEKRQKNKNAKNSRSSHKLKPDFFKVFLEGNGGGTATGQSIKQEPEEVSSEMQKSEVDDLDSTNTMKMSPVKEEPPKISVSGRSGRLIKPNSHLAGYIQTKQELEKAMRSARKSFMDRARNKQRKQSSPRDTEVKVFRRPGKGSPVFQFELDIAEGASDTDTASEVSPLKRIKSEDIAPSHTEAHEGSSSLATDETQSPKARKRKRKVVKEKDSPVDSKQDLELFSSEGPLNAANAPQVVINTQYGSQAMFVVKPADLPPSLADSDNSTGIATATTSYPYARSLLANSRKSPVAETQVTPSVVKIEDTPTKGQVVTMSSSPEPFKYRYTKSILQNSTKNLASGASISAQGVTQATSQSLIISPNAGTYSNVGKTTLLLRNVATATRARPTTSFTFASGAQDTSTLLKQSNAESSFNFKPGQLKSILPSTKGMTALWVPPSTQTSQVCFASLGNKSSSTSQSQLQGLLTKGTSTASVVLPVSSSGSGTMLLQTNTALTTSSSAVASQVRQQSVVKTVLPKPSVPSPVVVRQPTVHAPSANPSSASKTDVKSSPPADAKTKFYLLKVDGKNILIPMKGETVQPRAYLVSGKANTSLGSTDAKPSGGEDIALVNAAVSTLMSRTAEGGGKDGQATVANVSGSAPKSVTAENRDIKSNSAGQESNKDGAKMAPKSVGAPVEKEVTSPPSNETRVARETEKSDSVSDEADDKAAFSEGVNDRQERLRRLKELIKEKQKAVEELRQSRHCESVSDNAEDI